MYASLLRISGALYLGLFDQPVKNEFFSKLLKKNFDHPPALPNSFKNDPYHRLPVAIPQYYLWPPMISISVYFLLSGAGPGMAI